MEARHITISHNTFSDIVQDYGDLHPASSQLGWTAAISFYLSKRNTTTTPQGGERPVDTAANGISAFSDLSITDNTFTNWRPAAIVVRNARRVTITGNTFGTSLAGSTETYAPIKLFSMQGALIEDNVNTSGFTLLTTDTFCARVVSL